MTDLHQDDLGAVLGALAPGPRLIEAGGQGLDAAALAALRDGLHAGLAQLSPGAVARVGVLAAPELRWGFAVLALAERASILPLNPDLPEAELAAILAEAGADALLAAPEHAARAARLGLPLWQLDGPTLAGPPVTPTPGRAPGLVLLTSGSTGTPKRVALTAAQLFASAHNIARHFALGPADTALHALPMFHIGAFVDLVLAPLVSGGQVRAARDPGPAALAEALRAGVTWMQLVPTMLARCLAEWTPDEAARFGASLRFLRMVSADLSPELEARAGAALGCPLIQIYGMTETTGQIAANPLPPGEVKPGSVGPAAGAEIAILDETGAFLPPGREGEICLRGATVMAGYEGTDTPRHGDWLRSGDLGRLDGDGYLFLTGRLKEMINRGGEKVSPLTVERAALALPGVREAAAYALPHPTLGESVGLSVVADPEVTEAALLTGLATRLAEFQMPRRIRLRESFPRLGAGKVDRRRLAHDDRPDSSRPAEARAGLAKTVSDLWVEILKTPAPLDDDDFFDQGGDSLSATDFLLGLEKRLGRAVDPNLLFEAPRFAALTARLAAAAGQKPERHTRGFLRELKHWSSNWRGQRVGAHGVVIARNEAAAGAPVFFATLDGESAQSFTRLLGATRPHYILPTLRALRMPGEWRRRWLGRLYAREIDAIAPQGPLTLAGYCLGASVMEYAARALIRRGREVRLFLAIDHMFPAPTPYPVVLLWSNSLRYSMKGRYEAPERALWHWHPAGAAWYHADKPHRYLMSRDFLAPRAAALNGYLDGALPPPPAPPADGLSLAARRRRWKARIRVSAPRSYEPGTQVPVALRVTNTSPEAWPPTAESGLRLQVFLNHRKIRWVAPLRPWTKKLMGPLAAPLRFDRPVAPGETVTATIDVPFARVRGFRRINAVMIDDGYGFFGRASRRIDPAPRA